MFDTAAIACVKSEDVKEVNQFHILGKVTQIEGLTVTLLLKRNRRPPKTQVNEFSFTLIGELPIDAVGQYWQFIVQRQEWNWNIIEAQPAKLSQPRSDLSNNPYPRRPDNPHINRISQHHLCHKWGMRLTSRQGNGSIMRCL
jgi:hypothetical protein